MLKPAFYKEMSITCRKKMEIQTPVLFNEMKHFVNIFLMPIRVSFQKPG